jgi:hypothetical protein
MAAHIVTLSIYVYLGTRLTDKSGEEQEFIPANRVDPEFQ